MRWAWARGHTLDRLDCAQLSLLAAATSGSLLGPPHPRPHCPCLPINVLWLHERPLAELGSITRGTSPQCLRHKSVTLCPAWCAGTWPRFKAKDKAARSPPLPGGQLVSRCLMGANHTPGPKLPSLQAAPDEMPRAACPRGQLLRSAFVTFVSEKGSASFAFKESASVRNRALTQQLPQIQASPGSPGLAPREPATLRRPRALGLDT